MYLIKKRSNYKIWLIVIAIMVTGVALNTIFKEHSKPIGNAMAATISRVIKAALPQKKQTKRDNFCNGFGVIFSGGSLILIAIYVKKYFHNTAELQLNTWYESIIFLLLFLVILSLLFYIGYRLAYRTSEHFIWSDTKDYINDRYL